jgi:hypothetical protein
MIQQNADDSGLLFSYQPPPPGLLDQRHLDSALFDVEELERRRLGSQWGSPFGVAPSTGTPAPGSGVIDLAMLVSTAADAGTSASAPIIEVERAAAVVVELRSLPPSEPEVPVEPSMLGPRILIAACFVAFAVLLAMLVLE